MDFSNFETFIFDLDGTIWNWHSLLPGAKNLIEKLKKKGKQVLFVTNNSLYSSAGLIKKLRNFGIDVKSGELITSVSVAAKLLKKEGLSAFPVGKGVESELKAYGVKITNKPDYIVIGQDNNFNMKTLNKVYKVAETGANLMAVAAGRVWGMGKKMYPATGCILAPIEFITGKKAFFVGKPYDPMVRTVKAAVNSEKSKVVIFGDECKADMIFGKKLGYYTVFVKTGIDKTCSIGYTTINSLKEIEV